MSMRLLLLPIAIAILVFACATGEPPEPGEPAGEPTGEPGGQVADSAPPVPPKDSPPESEIEAEPDVARPENGAAGTDARGTETEAPETGAVPETGVAAAENESPAPATDATDTPADEAPVAQGSADTSTTTSLNAEEAPEAMPVSAPVVSEPWNYGAEPPPIPGVIDNSDVVAFYGHPLSFYMGILGETPIEEMADQLRDVAREYDAVNGRRTVAPAFHIIYATAYADANVGVLDSEVLAEYIEFAEENDFVVILDHQLGKHDVVESVRQMLPYLHYDSVHLAIDPEWSTLTPNEVIGSVHAEEINRAQQIIQDYLKEEGIDQRKMFIVHQFNWVMIEDRSLVRSDFERVDLVLNASGFGPPGDKTKTWDYLRAATNIPLKGFKLFYPKDWRDGGYDDPLMTPEEVLALEPRPVLIMYQ